METAGKLLKHGTYSTYCNAKCRCEACRAAAERYNGRRWALKKAERAARHGIAAALADEAEVWIPGEGWVRVSMPPIDDEVRAELARAAVVGFAG